jgi:hypothetical protein
LTQIWGFHDGKYSYSALKMLFRNEYPTSGTGLPSVIIQKTEIWSGYLLLFAWHGETESLSATATNDPIVPSPMLDERMEQSLEGCWQGQRYNGNTRVFWKYLYLISLDCAIAQAVSRRLPNAAARVRAQVRSCEICGGQSGTGAGFLQVLRFLLPIFIPPTDPHSSSIIPGWYNRPLTGRRANWTVSTHPKKLTN